MVSETIKLFFCVCVRPFKHQTNSLTYVFNGIFIPTKDINAKKAFVLCLVKHGSDKRKSNAGGEAHTLCLCARKARPAGMFLCVCQHQNKS